MAVIAIILGILMVLSSFLMNTGVDTGMGDVVNFAKLQHQMMILHTGLALVIVGNIAGLKEVLGRGYRAEGGIGVDADGDPTVISSRMSEQKKNRVILGVVGVVLLLLILVYAYAP